MERIPTGQFTEIDAYHYQRQSDLIAEQGYLPARDMNRWLPHGRDNKQLLPFYAYAIAYTHKAVAWLFPELTRYHIQLYAPTVCFVIGLAVLFLFLTRIYGLFFAFIVGILLATLPGGVERSAAGFGDRDAFYWMFGVLAVISYLWKESLPQGRSRYIVTVLAGFTVFLGGLSWEAFGIFVLIILITEIWKFCTTDTEQHLKEYLLWMLMFVPGLYLISPAYRSGYSFTTHIAALTLAPPIVIFALRGVRYLTLHYTEYFRPHARKLAWSLTFIGIMIGLCYLFFQASTFKSTAFTLYESELMKDVTELVDPNFKYWTIRYGSVFILGTIGLITTILQLWKWKGIPLTLSLSLFTGTTFFRDQVNRWMGADVCNTLFLISLVLTTATIAFILYFQKVNPKNALVTIAILAWFFLWVGIARGGKRYDFFIGLPLAYGTAWLIWLLPTQIMRKLKNTKVFYSQFSERWAAACLAIIILISVLFWNPLGGHANRAVDAAAKWRNPTPGQGTPLAQALDWMQTHLKNDAVVAAHWTYGSRLNTFGSVNTITDQDHYLPYRIHLYYQHVHFAKSERETLEYLKTHGATHVMLTKLDPKNTILRKKLSKAFVPVYIDPRFASIVIWEICYPLDIKSNPKYLATEPK